MAQIFTIGSDNIGYNYVCLALGDNIFHGACIIGMLKDVVRAAKENKKARAFGYWVNNPELYGVDSLTMRRNVIGRTRE